jgi:Mce-associated membrane protein
VALSGRRVAATAAGAATALALVIALIFTGARLAHESALNDARSAALNAATTLALDATNYDYRQIDQDYQAVIDRSTGDFRQLFLAASAGAKKKIIDFQARSQGKIYDAAVRDITIDRATVLVILDQQVVNSSPDGPRAERDRLRLTLVRSDGSWLVSKLESL